MTDRSLMDQLERAIQAMLADEQIMLAPDPELGSMLKVASDLQHLPRPEFLARLKTDLLKEGGVMSTTTIQPVREGFRTVTPYVCVPQAPELVEFIKSVFGAEETFRTVGSAGGFHIEVRVGDSMLMVGGGGAYKGPSKPASLHVFVHEVDSVYQRALDHGAKSLYVPMDQPYGVRDCMVEDLSGTQWCISTPMRDPKGRDIPGLGNVAPYLHPTGADRMVAFLKSAFEAEEVEVFHEPADGPIVHAKIRIVDSVIEMGEAHGQWQNMPTGFFLYVPDADTWFNRAVKAGAKVISPMANLEYGRSGGVQDEWGNEWYVCTV